MAYCPPNKRNSRSSAPAQTQIGDKFRPEEKAPPVDRIRSSLDDIRWVYKLERETDTGREEIAQVYGWYQISRCVESLILRPKERIIATPLYPLR